jgi:hypothetical protein
VGNGYLTKQAAGKGSVGSEVLEKIHRQYPTLNILWLLTGDGEMEIVLPNAHTQNAHPNAHPSASADGKDTEFEVAAERLKMTEKLNDILTQQNATLIGSNADKDRIIAMLEEQLKAVKTRSK